MKHRRVIGSPCRLSAADSGGGGVFAGRPGGAAALRGLSGRVGVQFGFDGVPALFAVLAPEGGAVGQDGVDLPPFAAGSAGDPELVLPGVAAGGVALVDGGQAGLGEPGLLGVDRVGAVDFDAQVVQGAALARVLQQDQLERRLGDGEVGVAGPALGRLGAEQSGVEGDRLVDVVDVQRELHPRHGNLRKILTPVYLLSPPSLPQDIDCCQYRPVSIPLTVISPAETAACCAPLTTAPLSMEQAEQVAPLLKALADPVRLRLMSLIASREGGEACICDLNEAFDLSQPTISHHMKVLHEAGLLDRDKRGVWVYYRVRPQALASLAALIGCAPQ